MLAKLVWYVLFLLSGLLYLVLLLYANARQAQLQLQSQSRLIQKPPHFIWRGGLFVTTQTLIAAGLIPIILIPWVLTGFFNLYFFLLGLAATELSYFLSYFFLHLFRLTQQHLSMRTLLSSFEKKTMMRIYGVLGWIVTLGYLIAITYIYVENPLRSDSAFREIFTVNLILFFAGTLFSLLANLSLISSPHVDDPMRRALFFVVASSVIPMGVYVTMYLNLTGEINKIPVLPHSVPGNYYVYVPAFGLTVLYLLLIVLPYFIGLERRRSHEIETYQRMTNWVRKIAGAVGIPSGEDLSQLTTLRGEMKQEIDELETAEPIVNIALQIQGVRSTGEEVEGAVAVYAAAYDAMKERDLRLVYLEGLQAMSQQMDEIIKEYENVETDPNRLQMHVMLAAPIENFFKDQRQQYELKIKIAEERKILAPVLARVAAVLGTVPVVVEFGQKLIKVLPFGH